MQHKEKQFFASVVMEIVYKLTKLIFSISKETLNVIHVFHILENKVQSFLKLISFLLFYSCYFHFFKTTPLSCRLTKKTTKVKLFKILNKPQKFFSLFWYKSTSVCVTKKHFSVKILIKNRKPRARRTVVGKLWGHLILMKVWVWSLSDAFSAKIVFY